MRLFSCLLSLFTPARTTVVPATAGLIDAAFGKENNIPVIKRIISESDVPVEVGGGIRDEATIKELIDIGVDRVIIGTKGIKEPDWLAEMVNKYPGKIVLSLDTKGGKITV